MSPRSDTGAATPVVLALVGVLVVCALAIGVVLDLLAARQRAADVADLAALGAVSSVLPSRDVACGAAAWVVRQHGATMIRCDLVDGDVLVVVAAPARGPAARVLARPLGGDVPEPRATARAGRR